MAQGPRYHICGSRLTGDTLVLRAILEGLNTQARQWSETITICDDGSLQGLEHEVDDFKHLERRRVSEWDGKAVILAFMDRLTHNGGTEMLLIAADRSNHPAFIISTYQGNLGKILP